MRLILAFLAVANWRWARADIARANRLTDEADAAIDTAYRRHAIAERLVARLGSTA